MNLLFSSSMDLTNLVFENRNKRYGAYLLRKTYPKNKVIAMLLSIMIFVSFVYFPNIYNYLKKEEVKILIDVQPVIWDDLFEKPKVERTKAIEKILPGAQKNANSNRSSGFNVVPDDSISNEENNLLMTGVHPINNEINGNSNIENANGSEDIQIGGSAAVNGTSEEIVLFAEEMPVYESGDEDLYKYLGKNIRYPPIAKENRIEGRVIVEFIIDKKGSPQAIHVLRGIGGGCDEEVIRVIKNMPYWKAGKHNGVPVNVKMVLPVIFKLQ